MNTNPYQNQAANPYSSVPRGENATLTEAWALVSAARKIAESFEVSDDKERKAAMQAALRTNWKLWTIFQAELSLEEEASVQGDLRINILTLAKFVDNQTVQQLPNPDPERLLVLIDINRNIANGLLEGAKASEDQKIEQQVEASQAAPAAPSENAETPDGPPPGLPSGFEQEA